MSKQTEKYCIVGVGETNFTKHAERTTRAMAVEAVKKALRDAGVESPQVDGIMSFNGSDSVESMCVASDLGIRPNFYMDVNGGGSTPEALVGVAMGAIETGMCNVLVIFRSMLGYTGERIGGTGTRAQRPIPNSEILERLYGLGSPAQKFAPAYMRHMMEYGTKNSQVANIRAVQSHAACNNPKALYKERVTVDEVLNSRWIVKPLHLLDCCVETDNAVAIVLTSADRARDLRQRPIYVMGVAGRVCNPRPDAYFGYGVGPITRVAGYYAKDIIFPMAGIRPDDVDVTGAYDCFTFTVLMQLEEYGFCRKGEGGGYVSSGIIELGGKNPINTSGGQLCEAYTQGMNLIIENVRQLRGQADDYCPGWAQGEHTYDYSEGHCRQVKNPEIAMNLGWSWPGIASALILRR